MRVTISKWGNSQGIRIPKELMLQAHFSIGTMAEAEFCDGTIVITPIKRAINYNIHDLVKGITPQKNREVEWGKSEGSEIW